MQNKHFYNFMASEDAPSGKAFAALLGISEPRVSALKHGGNWTPELALKAEKVTGGKLDAGKLNATIRQVRKDIAA
jgi:DNA-binding transcriptional regulator YdaS (Cro superfamily)